MKQIIQKSLVVLALFIYFLPSEAQTVRRDRREDVRDRHEDVRDRREDVRDQREDVRDARHQGGPLDRVEDRRDRREDVRDKREDVRDRREDRRDRRRKGTYNTQQHPQPTVRVQTQVGFRWGASPQYHGPRHGYGRPAKRHRHHHHRHHPCSACRARICR